MYLFIYSFINLLIIDDDNMNGNNNGNGNTYISINRLKYSNTIANQFEINTEIVNDQKHFVSKFSTKSYRLLSPLLEF